MRRLGERRRGRLVLMQPADSAWHDMLARIDAAEAERRLAAAESALNRLR